MTPLEEAVARKLLDMASQRLGIDLGPWDSLDTNTKDRYLEDALGILALPEIVKMQEALERCADIVEHNLYHQREKVEGVVQIARAALQPLKKEAE